MSERLDACREGLARGAANEVVGECVAYGVPPCGESQLFLADSTIVFLLFHESFNRFRKS
jgi:hypothetical protein